jgi:hypothetical protein
MQDTNTFQAGAWAGKSLAFGLIRQRCSAAQAECLKQIREGKLHETLGLGWDEFCRLHLGMDRSYADRLIRYLDRFGADYFRLSEIVRMSPETYRALRPAISNQHIEIDGEKVLIAPENALRIRTAVTALRSELIQAKELAPTITCITDLQLSVDSAIAAMRKLRRSTDPCTKASLEGLIRYSAKRFRDLAAELA